LADTCTLLLRLWLGVELNVSAPVSHATGLLIMILDIWPLNDKGQVGNVLRFTKHHLSERHSLICVHVSHSQKLKEWSKISISGYKCVLYVGHACCKESGARLQCVRVTEEGSRICITYLCVECVCVPNEMCWLILCFRILRNTSNCFIRSYRNRKSAPKTHISQTVSYNGIQVPFSQTWTQSGLLTLTAHPGTIF